MTRDFRALILLACAPAVAAFGIDERVPPAVPEPHDAPVASESQSYYFEFRDKPWPAVFLWLTELSQLPLINNFQPTGTFTFIPPSHRTRYTLEEITDILDDALHGQNLMLVRREFSLIIMPTDEQPKSPPKLMLSRPDQLRWHHRSEVITLLYPLTNLNARAIVPDSKKMLGPSGDVRAIEKTNQLVMWGKVADLRRVHEMIRALEQGKAAK
jgi:type II secretory pathway component GspD/PulD (secretin)